MPLYVELPPNLCKEIQHEGKSVYYRDYCARYKNGMKKSAKPVTHAHLITSNSSVDKLIMDNHYSTLPLGYSKKHMTQTIQNLRRKQTAESRSIKEQPATHLQGGGEIILRPENIRKIENAWVDEVHTDKRSRGNIYGIVGKKIELKRKNSEKMDHEKSPAFDQWLKTSNEFEKQVVHDFLSKVNGDISHRSFLQEEIISNGDKEGGNEEEDPDKISVKIERKVRLQSPPKSAPPLLSKRSSMQGNTLYPSPLPPQTPDDESKRVSSAASSVSSRSSASSRSSNRSMEAISVKEVSTQLPHTGKPSSPLYSDNGDNEETLKIEAKTRHRRIKTAPPNYKAHSCQNCNACREKLYKRMMKQLAGVKFEGPDQDCEQFNQSYSQQNQEYEEDPRMVSHYVFRPAVEDYTHPATSFQRVNGRKKGYFTIHPDFVSENRKNAWQKWKVQRKFLGESKSIL